MSMGTDTSTAREPLVAHVDLDAFFASAELLRRPELVGRPVAVGGKGPRGVIATANYEARLFKVGSAMPTRMALERCRQLVVLPPDFEWYKTLSVEVMVVLAEMAEELEPMSLDEAFVRFGDEVGFDEIEAAAIELRARVKQRTGLAISVGVGPSRTVAKLASDAAKPDGLCIVRPVDVASFLAATPLSKIPGVGPATLAVLEKVGISRTRQLAQVDASWLGSQLGHSAAWLVRAAAGQDSAELGHRELPSSVGAEETLERDVGSQEALATEVERLGREALRRLARLGMGASGVSVKVRTVGFKDLSRSTSTSPTNSPAVLARAWRSLVDELWRAAGGASIRLVGVSFTGLGEQVQGDLFSEPGWKLRRLLRVGEQVTHRAFGQGKVMVSDPDYAIVRFADKVRVIDDPRRWLELVQPS